MVRNVYIIINYKWLNNKTITDLIITSNGYVDRSNKSNKGYKNTIEKEKNKFVNIYIKSKNKKEINENIKTKISWSYFVGMSLLM